MPFSPLAPISSQVGTEVEPVQPGHPGRLAPGDLVEGALHPRGEVVVDQVGEVPPTSRVTTAKATNEGTSAVPFLNT